VMIFNGLSDTKIKPHTTLHTQQSVIYY